MPIVGIILATLPVLQLWQPDLGTLLIVSAIGLVITAVVLIFFFRSVRAGRGREE